MGVSNAVFGLGLGIALRIVLQIGNNGACADFGQFVVQGLSVVIGENRAGMAADNGTGVEPGVHLHDADAGFAIARFNSALDGCGTAPARQQRGVDVEAAVARDVEHGLRQQQAVGGHHHDVGFHSAQHFLCGLAFQAFGLGYLKTEFERGFFDGRSLQLHAAPFGTVGLGEHQRDVEAGPGNGAQGGGGEIGGAGKNNFANHGFR